MRLRILLLILLVNNVSSSVLVSIPRIPLFRQISFEKRSFSRFFMQIFRFSISFSVGELEISLERASYISWYTKFSWLSSLIWPSRLSIVSCFSLYVALFSLYSHTA